MVVGPGTELAGYRVKHTVGEGGMAIVHLAERLSDGRQVVLKVLRCELVGDEHIRRRFLRESRYADALEHPNVVRVLESGEHGDVLYIAMQYVEGTDLYTMLEDGPLGPDVTIAILAQMADALDAAHAIGLLHRDVKPGNVLVAGAGTLPRCFLTDFGLSRQVSRDSMALTAAGSFVGTLAYMAPEQMLGDDPGPPVDVYALGCLLFECLTGDPPYTGRPESVMQAHFESPPPKLAKKGSTFTRAIDAVIARALAKDPGERYPTCTELVLAAAAALEVQLPEPDAFGSPAGPDPSQPPEALELRVTAGGAKGATIAIDGELLIGRDQAGLARLGGDPELSRRHALIRGGAGGPWTIEDLGSHNHTYVNGRRIEDAVDIDPGDEISVGESTLVVAAAAVAVDHPTDVAAAERPPAITALALRVTFAPELGMATLRLDEHSQPIALRYHAGSWLLAEPASHDRSPSENARRGVPSG